MRSPENYIADCGRRARTAKDGLYNEQELLEVRPVILVVTVGAGSAASRAPIPQHRAHGFHGIPRRDSGAWRALMGS